MVEIPAGFHVKQAPAPSSGAPPIPEGFRVKASPAPQEDVRWTDPGMIVPIQHSSKGEMRWAVPQIVTDTIDAIMAPGKALRGEYGSAMDPETGIVRPDIDAMMGDAAGLAGLAMTPLNPVAKAGASFGKAVINPGANNMIRRELANAGISPADVPSLMRSMGPNTMVADLSPGLQARAAAIATMPGSGQKTVVDALAARKAGANVRIQTGVDDVLGPAPIPSYLQADITAQKKALSPYYRDVLAGDGVKAVDTQPIADALDAMVINDRGATQSTAATVRKMLNLTDNPNVLDPSPDTLLATRQAVGGMLAKAESAIEKDPTQIGALKRIYGQLDEALTAAVPNIKDVDAQYQELARQSGALDMGQTLLDTGRDSMRPQEVADLMNGGGPQFSRTADGGPVAAGKLIGPSAVPLRLSQGARSEIDRIIGNNTNDITAMKRILQGEGNWNRDRLATTFGADRAAKLLDIFEQEARQAVTEQLALQGSRTQVLKAAQDDIVGKGPRANPVRSLADLKFGTAAADFLDNGLGWISAEKRASTNNQVAQALIARAGDQPMMNTLAAPSSDKRRAVTMAMMRALALGGL